MLDDKVDKSNWIGPNLRCPYCGYEYSAVYEPIRCPNCDKERRYGESWWIK